MIKASKLKSGKPSASWLLWAIVMTGFVVSVIAMGIVCMSTSPKQNDQEPLCLSCNLLRSSTHYHEKALLLRVEGDRCCADTAQQIAAVLSLVVDKLQTPAGPAPPVSLLKRMTFSSVFAHKHLMWNPHYSIRRPGERPRFIADGNTVPLAINDTYSQQDELSEGVTLQPAGIKIEKTGLYHAYESVNFLTKDACRTLEKQTFMSYLVRRKGTNGQEFALLRSEHTCCMDCKQNKESAYSAGQFYLVKGDVLTAEVTSIDVVNFNPESSFVGLFLLGGQVPETTTESLFLNKLTKKTVKGAPQKI